MALRGTQTTANEPGGPDGRLSQGTFLYPVKAVYPGAVGNQYVQVGVAQGGGISVFAR